MISSSITSQCHLPTSSKYLTTEPSSYQYKIRLFATDEHRETINNDQCPTTPGKIEHSGKGRIIYNKMKYKINNKGQVVTCPILRTK